MAVNTGTCDTTPADSYIELPDIPAISSAEVTLPTLNMNSSELGDISLSGLISTIIAPDQDPSMQVVQVDSNTIQGQNQPITFHLQPMENQMNQQQQQQPIRDVRDNIQGFAPPHQAWTNDLQNILEPKIVSQTQEEKPYVRILEQPASHKLRFRYKCEGRGAGALQGVSSSPDKKTFPKIQIVGYKGPAVVVVSCVTHDSDVPKTHPHNLVSPASVGREGCKKGVCTVYVNNEEMTAEFPHLGVQCVRRKDVHQSLSNRQQIKVDPFRQGFSHADNSALDLNAIRLCFQAFLENPSSPGKYKVVLDPVVSHPIFDAKAKKELQIMDMSDNSSSVEGGKKIILLCEKITREDIKVRFYDPINGWEGWGQFSASNVHKQYGISLVTPAYTHPLTGAGVRRVRVELVKPSDGATSEHVDFYYTNTSNIAGFDNILDESTKENQYQYHPSPVRSQSRVKLERLESTSSSFNPLIFDEDEENDTANIGDFDAFTTAVNNLSGKIESFSLSDVVETSLNILRPSTDHSRLDIKRSTSEAYSYGEVDLYTLGSTSDNSRGGIKRSTSDAYSSGEVDPKQSLLHTPGNSDKIYSLMSTSEPSRGDVLRSTSKCGIQTRGEADHFYTTSGLVTDLLS